MTLRKELNLLEKFREAVIEEMATVMANGDKDEDAAFRMAFEKLLRARTITNEKEPLQ